MIISIVTAVIIAFITIYTVFETNRIKRKFDCQFHDLEKGCNDAIEDKFKQISADIEQMKTKKECEKDVFAGDLQKIMGYSPSPKQRLEKKRKVGDQ